MSVTVIMPKGKREDEMPVRRHREWQVFCASYGRWVFETACENLAEAKRFAATADCPVVIIPIDLPAIK